MDVFEANINTLKRERKDFFSKIEIALKNGKAFHFNPTMIEARDGCQVLMVEKDGKRIRLNSVYRPRQEAECWSEQYEYRHHNINIMMFGMGNLLFVNECIKRMQEDSYIYIYEPCIEIFDFVLHKVDMTTLIQDKRVFFYLVGVNEESFYYDLAARTHWSNLETQIDCFHPGYPELFPKEYERFGTWILQCDTTEVINRNTGARFSKIFVENILQNLHFVLDGNSIWELEGKFAVEIPAILVASGPSLNKNIHLLKRAEGKAFIIATDTAVRHLIREKIKFDAMVTVDPQKHSDYLMIPECREIPLFCNLGAKAEILAYHTGRKIWFREPVDYLKTVYAKFKKRFLFLDAGANVAASAWTISRVLGFKRIILVGQDLAYVDGFTHAGGQNDGISADGTYYSAGKVKDENSSGHRNNLYVEGIDGKKIQTRDDWKVYLEWYEREIARYKNEVETIDATEGGALIHGTKVMSLKKAITLYCKKELDFCGILSEIPPSFQKDRTEVKKELLHIKKECELILGKSARAVELGNKALALLIKDINSPEIENYVREIAKINTFIARQPIQSLIILYIEKESAEIIKKSNRIFENDVRARIDTITSMKDYHELIIQAITELLPIVNRTMIMIEKEK